MSGEASCATAPGRPRLSVQTDLAWARGSRRPRCARSGHDDRSGFGGGRGGPGGGQAKVWQFLANKYDKNKDGKLTGDEYDRGVETFARLDRNEDGVLTPEDWAGVTGPFGSGEGQRPGDGLKGVAPKQGEPAPDFELSYVAEPEKTVSLSSFAGKKPVALIFGSCT